MPYLPPDNLEPDDLDCILVFYPKAVEYRQALLGQIAELSDVWNWEASRDDQQKIRRAWLEAELETTAGACMGICDDLFDQLQRIEDCSCTGALPSNESYPTPGGDVITPYEGPYDVPTNTDDYATDPFPVTPQSDLDGSGTVDLAEWKDYVCGASNLVVDALIDWLRFVRFIKNVGGAINDSIAYLLPLIADLIPGQIDDAALLSIELLSDLMGYLGDVQIAQIDAGIAALDAQRDALNCAMRGQLTVAGAINAFLAVLSGAGVDAVIIGIIQTGPMPALAALIWNAAFDSDVSYTCQCNSIYWSPQMGTQMTGVVPHENYESGGLRWKRVAVQWYFGPPFDLAESTKVDVRWTQVDTTVAIKNETSADTWRMWDANDSQVIGNDAQATSMPGLPEVGQRIVLDNRDLHPGTWAEADFSAQITVETL